MDKKRVLAFDFGASSGRAIIGEFDGKIITLKEVHRFSNDPVMLNETLYWDFLRLFFEVKQGIIKAKEDGGFESIGVDTWGVDFGLLDKDGKLLENPIHYRDLRTDGLVEKSFEIINKNELYCESGVQMLQINTLYQLIALKKQRPDLFSRIDKLLFMPNLFAYFLTGEKTSEFSIASTSQLMDIKTASWSKRILEAFDIPSSILTDISYNDSPVGYLTDELCEELSCEKAKVISVCGHDTASAAVAIPSDESDVLYLSSGTWSIMGTWLEKPILTDLNLANEGGYNGSILYSSNIVGLWLIQESRREWKRQGKDYSFADLESLAVEAGKTKCYIDPDDKSFAPAGNLPKRVCEYCERTNQYVPQTVGEIVRCIYESLAKKYAEIKVSFEKATNKQYSCLNVIGGGVKDTFLCQLTADYIGCKVVAGPIEATAFGNIAVQLIQNGIVKDLKEARKIIAASVSIKEYIPRG